VAFELSTLVTRLGVTGLSESISSIHTMGASMDELALKGRGVRATFLYMGFGAWQMSRLMNAASKYLMGFVKSSVSAFAVYEQTLKRTAVIADATAAETEHLGKTFLSLGRQTEFMTTEIGQAAQKFALAGFRANEIITALPATLALATIGMLDTAAATKFATQLIRGFRLEVEDLNYVVNSLTYAITNSLNTMHALSISLPYVAGIAAELNYELTDMVSALMILADAGIESSKAGMALRTGLTRVAKAIGIVNEEAVGAEAVIRKYGFQFETQEGQMKDLAGVIDELNDKLAGLSEQEKIVALNALFGLRYGTYYLMLMDKGGDVIRENTKAQEAWAVKSALVSHGFRDTTYTLKYWRNQVQEGEIYMKYFTDTLGMSAKEAELLDKIIRSSTDDFNDYTKAIEKASYAEEKRFELLQTLSGLQKLMKSDIETIYVTYAKKITPALELIFKLLRLVYGVVLKLPGKGVVSNIMLIAGATTTLAGAVFGIIAPLAMMVSSIAIMGVKYTGVAGPMALVTTGLQMFSATLKTALPLMFKAGLYLFAVYKIAQVTMLVYESLNAVFGKGVATIGALVFAFAALNAATMLFWKINIAISAAKAILWFWNQLQILILMVAKRLMFMNTQLTLSQLLMGPIGWLALAIGAAGVSYYALKKRAEAPVTSPVSTTATTKRTTYINVDVHGNTVNSDSDFAKMVGEEITESVLRAHDEEFERVIG